MESKKMIVGQRVEIIDGSLQGEKATVMEIGQYGDEGWVLVRFDQHNAHKGSAILSPQRIEIERLKVI